MVGEVLGALLFAGFSIWALWSGGAYLGRSGWDGWRRRAAAKWPLANGTIETGYVEPFQRFHAAMLGYSYAASGKHFSGYWRRGPMNQDAAEMLIIRTRGRNLAVRYKPENPADSIVRLEDNPKWVPWSL